MNTAPHILGNGQMISHVFAVHAGFFLQEMWMFEVVTGRRFPQPSPKILLLCSRALTSAVSKLESPGVASG